MTSPLPLRCSADLARALGGMTVDEVARWCGEHGCDDLRPQDIILFRYAPKEALCWPIDLKVLSERRVCR